MEAHNGLTGLIAEKAAVMEGGEIRQFDGMWAARWMISMWPPWITSVPMDMNTVFFSAISQPSKPAAARPRRSTCSSGVLSPLLSSTRSDYVVHGDDWREGFQKPVREECLELLAEYGGELVEFPYSHNGEYAVDHVRPDGHEYCLTASAGQ